MMVVFLKAIFFKGDIPNKSNDRLTNLKNTEINDFTGVIDSIKSATVEFVQCNGDSHGIQRLPTP